MLKLPPTLRVPNSQEHLDDPEVLERIKKRESANIVEGYSFQNNDSNKLPFKFYAEINIDNNRLWALFNKLITQLPGEISCIYNLHEDEPTYSSYLHKIRVLKIINNYELELTQDCFLELGLLSHTQEKLVEVFIADVKFIKFWGVEENAFREIMNEFQLKEIPNIEFVDEFPKTIETLTKFNSNAKNAAVVIAELDFEFKN